MAQRHKDDIKPCQSRWRRVQVQCAATTNKTSTDRQPATSTLCIPLCTVPLAIKVAEAHNRYQLHQPCNALERARPLARLMHLNACGSRLRSCQLRQWLPEALHELLATLSAWQHGSTCKLPALLLKSQLGAPLCLEQPATRTTRRPAVHSCVCWAMKC